MKTYSELLVDLLSGKFSLVAGMYTYTHDGYKYQGVIDGFNLIFHVWQEVTEYVHCGAIR